MYSVRPRKTLDVDVIVDVERREARQIETC